jgi:predicted Zn finger-like uncharacterized protein
MRLGCPNCGALYEVADTAVPASGRDVQCSACGHRWLHRPSAANPAPPADAAKPRRPENEPAAPPPVFVRAATPATPPATATDEAPRVRPTDPAVLQILREEAAREMEQRRRATFRAQDRDPAPARAEPAPDASPPRRALLPDIDEVDPTLEPSRRRDGSATVVHRAPDAQPRGSVAFAAGFAVSLAFSALAAAAYFWSAELAAAIPALAGPLTGYADAVDTLRQAIHPAVR